MTSPTPDSPQGPIDIQGMVFDSNAGTQARFRETFPKELDRTIAGITSAYQALERFQHTVEDTPRAATVHLFFHAALNTVLCSAHHLVSGYPIAAGNLMRHHVEAVAMALLCVDPSINTFDVFTADRRHFAVDHAPGMLRQKAIRKALKEKLDFDEEAWEVALDIKKLYDNLSHSSALSLGHHVMLDTDDQMILGGEFDPAKLIPYRTDLTRRASAAEVLAHVIGVVTDVMPKRTAA